VPIFTTGKLKPDSVIAQGTAPNTVSFVEGAGSNKFAKGQTEFALTSPLTGLGLALPAPLNKPADATWPLTVSTTASLEEARKWLRIADSALRAGDWAGFGRAFDALKQVIGTERDTLSR